MQPKTYTLPEIIAILNLTPEAFLRDYGRVHVVDPTSDNPRFFFVRKDESDVNIDLPQGSIEIASIGHNRDIGVYRLSAMGDLPTDLATKIMNAIDWRRLDVDRANHSSYGFFTTTDREHSHFLMTRDSHQATRITRVNGKPVTKLEFAVDQNGDLQLCCIADERFYHTSVKPSNMKKDNLNWESLDIPGNPRVNDFSARIVDGKFGVALATTSGAYLWRNNEISPYHGTDRKNVVTVVAGIPYHTTPKVDTDRYTDRMAFVVRKDDGTNALYTCSVTPKNDVTSVDITDKTLLTTKSDVRILAGNDGRWYLGAHYKVTAIEIPNIIG